MTDLRAGRDERRERDDLSRVVRSFLTQLYPLESTRDRAADAGVDRGAWRRLAAELDLLGVRVAEQDGGQGLGLELGVLVAHELGRTLAPVPYLETVSMGAELIGRLGTPEQKARWLPAVVAGDLLIATSALDEPVAQVRAVAVESGHRLEGFAPLVLGGADADVLLVLAEADGVSSIYAVLADAEGLDRTRLTAVDRTRRWAAVRLDGCRGERLGGDGAEVEAAMLAVKDEVSVLLAAEAVGASDHVLATVVEYARVREQFGHPIGSYQAVQHELADLFGEVESARAAVEWAAAVVGDEAGDPLDRAGAAALSAMRATEAFERTARQGLHLHGGIGFTWEHDSHLFLKRSLGDRPLVTTQESSRDLVAAALFS